MSKRGLGRGLSALIPSASQESQPARTSRSCRSTCISPNPDQPRTDIDEERIAELADSITKVGRPAAHHRSPHRRGLPDHRRRAAVAGVPGLAGLERVPVWVLDADETESLELALIENLQREDLNAIEEARGYRKLLTELSDDPGRARRQGLEVPLDDHERASAARSAGGGPGAGVRRKLTAGHARAVLSVPMRSQRDQAGREDRGGRPVCSRGREPRATLRRRPDRARSAARDAEVLQAGGAQAAPAARHQRPGQARSRTRTRSRSTSTAKRSWSGSSRLLTEGEAPAARGGGST